MLSLFAPIALLLGSLGGSPAQAATIDVDTTSDGFVDDGQCGLREALEAADSDTAAWGCPAGEPAPAVDVLVLPEGTFTVAAQAPGGVGGALQARGDLVVQGAGRDQTVIDGSAAESKGLVDVAAGAVVAFTDLSLVEGTGVRWGAIHNLGDLTLERVVLRDHRVTGCTPDLYDDGGGAVRSPFGSRLTLSEVLVEGNEATQGCAGGAIHAGGGVDAVDTSFVDNTAHDAGGALFLTDNQVTLRRVTLHGNSSQGVGGAMALVGGDMSLAESTVAGNHAWSVGGGAWVSAGASLTLARTLIGGNVAPSSPSCKAEGDAVITSLGYNLVQHTSGCALGGTVEARATDVDDVAPDLLDLEQRASDLPTAAPSPSSPAVDVIPLDDCPAVDQRGVQRPLGSGCDIGAHERGCGDDWVDPDEQCDEGAGNSDGPDATCRTTCVVAGCGDGLVEGDEECDEGVDNSDAPDATCRTDCTAAGCGDGILDDGEQCDEGVDNADAPDAFCRTDCSLAGCGDGVVDSDEACDEGADNADDPGAACRPDCTAAGCGDGIVDPDEACDDGDVFGADGCSETCEVEQGWECEGVPSDCSYVGEDIEEPKDEGGCRTGPGPVGAWWLGLLALGLRRRRPQP